MSLRCIIVDDHRPFANAARLLLESEGLTVVATASTGPEAIALVREFELDVVILDIDLGGESGFDVARDLIKQPAQGTTTGLPRIVLVSAHDEKDFADLISQSGAAGFLTKSDLSAQAIRQLLCLQKGE
ncbi:MAG: response regulator transcription factor [Jatrophihabitantaceae bacterium]